MPPHKALNSGIQFSPTIADNHQFLRSLAKTKSTHKRKRLLKSATTQQLLSLVEIALNILRNRFRLTHRQKNRMLPFAQFIRRLGRIRSERGARKLIVQKGSGLPIAAFASLLTPVIIELARSLTTSSGNNQTQ